MAEGIMTPEGTPVPIEVTASDQVEQNFARAMSEPTGDDSKAPPKRAEKPAKGGTAQDKPRVSRGPGRPAAAKSAPATGLSKEVRKQGIQGIVQLGAGGLLLAERGTNNKAFRADAITLASSADEIGSAVADVCDQDEKFARVVDKLCAAGPYSALITVMFSVGSQIARNHGASVPGTQAPEDLIQMAEAAAA